MDDYSLPLGRLFKWFLLTIDLRIEDVLNRRDRKEKLKEERHLAEEAFAERERIRKEACEIAMQEHEAREEERINGLGDDVTLDDPKRKKRDFEEKPFYRKWDAENAKIDVPPQVVDDIDNDYDFPDERNRE